MTKDYFLEAFKQKHPNYGKTFVADSEFDYGNNDDFSYGETTYCQRGLTCQSILYKGEYVGNIYYQETNFLVPVAVWCETVAVLPVLLGVSGPEEWYYQPTGAWGTTTRFVSMPAFEEYVLDNLEYIQHIIANTQ